MAPNLVFAALELSIYMQESNCSGKNQILQYNATSTGTNSRFCRTGLRVRTARSHYMDPVTEPGRGGGRTALRGIKREGLARLVSPN